MHPINNKNFGPGAGTLAVSFFDGSAVVTGYIVKQTGTSKYLVSATDGTGQKICRLAQTTSELTALTAGTGDDAALRGELCTIEVAVFGGGTENAKKITDNHAFTVQGTKVTYERGATGDAAGEGTIDGVDNAAPTVANPIPDQTGTVAAIFSYAIPANTFADANGDTLTLTMTPVDAFAFDGTTVTKAAGAGTAAAHSVVITATDGGGLTVSDTFLITLS